MGCYDGSPQTFDIAWAWSEKSLIAVDELIHHSIFSPQPATQVLQKAQVVMTMGPSLKIWQMIYKVEFLGLIWSWCMHACVKNGWLSLVNQTYYYKTTVGSARMFPTNIIFPRVCSTPRSLWPSQATSAANAMKSARAHVEELPSTMAAWAWEVCMCVCVCKCYITIRQSNMAIDKPPKYKDLKTTIDYYTDYNFQIVQLPWLITGW